MTARPPFRAEQVGSLLRPPELKAAHGRLRRGEIDQAGYDAVLAAAIADAVRMQEAAGLQSISDGEFGRSSWFGFFFERMSGFELEPSAFRFKDGSGETFEWPTCHACATIRRHSPICVDEYRRLRGLTARTPKVTMPSPSAFHFFRLDAPADPAAYPDVERYWDDLIAVYRAEVADLIAAGCRYIQFDEVPLAMLCDPSIREQVQGLGEVSRRVSDMEAANSLAALYISAKVARSTKMYPNKTGDFKKDVKASNTPTTLPVKTTVRLIFPQEQLPDGRICMGGVCVDQDTMVLSTGWVIVADTKKDVHFVDSFSM